MENFINHFVGHFFCKQTCIGLNKEWKNSILILGISQRSSSRKIIESLK
jgi:hypothetical protein